MKSSILIITSLKMLKKVEVHVVCSFVAIRIYGGDAYYWGIQWLVLLHGGHISAVGKEKIDPNKYLCNRDRACNSFCKLWKSCKREKEDFLEKYLYKGLNFFSFFRMRLQINWSLTRVITYVFWSTWHWPWGRLK